LALLLCAISGSRDAGGGAVHSIKNKNQSSPALTLLFIAPAAAMGGPFSTSPLTD
jgi:hypothetical protein